MGMLLRLLVLMIGLIAGLPLTAFAGVPVVSADGEVPSLAPLLKGVTPSVVNIAVLAKKSQEPQVAGSGVIVDAKAGYVLTNHHVIARADKIIVTLKDNRKFEAKLVGSDPDTDVVLLQIEARNLKALPIGDVA